MTLQLHEQAVRDLLDLNIPPLPAPGEPPTLSRTLIREAIAAIKNEDSAYCLLGHGPNFPSIAPATATSVLCARCSYIQNSLDLEQKMADRGWIPRPGSRSVEHLFGLLDAAKEVLLVCYQRVPGSRWEEIAQEVHEAESRYIRVTTCLINRAGRLGNLVELSDGWFDDGL